MSNPTHAGLGSGAPKGRVSNTPKDTSDGWHSRGYLPHFDSSHVIQHITYRLADSLPRAVLDQMRAEVGRTALETEQGKNDLRQRIEAYLDAGYGSCVLQAPEVARVVIDTWRHFDGERYRLLAWVVMPNHCHVLIEPFAGVPLGKIVLSWKNYTARFINQYKARGGQDAEAEVCRTGVRRSQVRGAQVWQRDYWDRYIRDERHLAAAIEYIVMNPVKAGLVAAPTDWPWSSARVRREGVGG
jgi:putative transposase